MWTTIILGVVIIIFIDLLFIWASKQNPRSKRKGLWESLKELNKLEKERKQREKSREIIK